MNRKDRRVSRAAIGAGRRPSDAADIDSLLRQGMAQHRAGDLAAAAAAYEKVLAVRRRNADALNLLGLVHHQRGDPDTALALMRRAADIAPANPFVRNNIGMVLRALGRDAEAEKHFRRALALDADYPEPRINLGNTLLQRGDIEGAIAVLTEGIRRAPVNAETHAVLGLALAARGATAEAGDCFRRAAELDPRAPAHRYNLGNHYYAVDRDDAAEQALRTAIALDAGFAEAWRQLGGVLRRAGRRDEAVAVLRKALELAPSDVEAWLALGATLKDLRRLDEAREAFLTAFDIDPDSAEAHNELGYVARCAGQFDAAVAAYDKALAIAPKHPHAAANRALVLLAEGRFAEGWPAYTLSGSAGADGYFRDRLPLDLTGRRVVLQRDQGLGDQIFFLRFLPALQARGASVVYRGQQKILSLIERVAGLDAVLDEARTPMPADADYRLLISDLPYALGMTRTDDIPPSISIPVAADRATRMAELLAGCGPAPYIGVTWRAGVQQIDHLSKEVPLERLAAALKGCPGTVIAVQRNPAGDELECLSDLAGRTVCDLTALNEDLEEMLAVLAGLDHYVCVSNTNTHLRAALGRTSRVLVPYPADFRWMNRGEESPWFPATRVYRQSHAEGWEPALATLACDLATPAAAS